MYLKGDEFEPEIVLNQKSASRAAHILQKCRKGSCTHAFTRALAEMITGVVKLIRF